MLKNILSIIILNLMLSGIQCQSEEGDFWLCKNGSFIPIYKVCNGHRDCSDGSDEFTGNSVISSPCLKEECSNSNAKCYYGACIPLESWCNNITDCADNSDEWKQNCNKNGNSNELSCESGEFIEKELFCDGKADCDDDSDENEIYCSLQKCNSTQFRCKYGGCIDKNKKCNDKIECIDGTDESIFYAFCPPRLMQVGQRINTIVGCMIPHDPNHDILNENENVNWASGFPVPEETRISIKCKSNYSLSTRTSAEIRTCGPNGWNYQIPTCIKFCSAELLRRSPSTIAECKHETTPVKCENIVPNTVAVISCANSYRMPAKLGSDPIHSMTCERDSKWSTRKFNCEPICGIIENDATASQAPWHVRIRAQGIVVCGGTIISPNLVITALHCLLDEESVVLNASYVQVNAVKEVQMYRIMDLITNVSHIYAPGTHDVALLQLSDPLVLSKNIRPICYTFAISEFTSNKQGFVNSWLTRKTNIETLSHSDCNVNMTDDQFCVRPVERMANNPNQKSYLCEGDSGSGVIEKRNSGKHYLIGIISHKPTHTFPCTTDPVVAVDFTKIPEALKTKIVDEVEDLYEDE